MVVGNHQQQNTRDGFRKMQTLQRIDAPFFSVPSGNENAVWVEPVLCCTVKYMEKTASGGLRQPVFKGIREDKEPEACVEEDQI